MFYVLNHYLFNPFFTVLFFPVRGLAPVWVLVWISLVTAVLALFVYRYFSSQTSIRKVKDLLKAHILELRLYQHHPALMGRALKNIFVCNIRYLSLNLKPFCYMILPVLLILVQTEVRLGYRPLQPGESVLLKTVWREGVSLESLPSGVVRTSANLLLETPALHITQKEEIDWRLRATSPGPAEIVFSVDGVDTGIPVKISDGVEPISRWNGPTRAPGMFWNPAATPLSREAKLASVEIAYPARDLDFLGWRTHWIWPFLALTLVAGYLLKGLFRVTL